MTKTRKLQTVNTMIIVMILSALALVALTIYALKHIEVSALRWWAGVATLLVVTGIPGAFILGRYGARERIAGMDIALDKLNRAASQAIDLRRQSAAAVRRAATSPPASPGGGANSIDPSSIVITHTNQRNDTDVITL